MYLNIKSACMLGSISFCLSPFPHFLSVSSAVYGQSVLVRLEDGPEQVQRVWPRRIRRAAQDGADSLAHPLRSGILTLIILGENTPSSYLKGMGGGEAS